VGEGLQNGADKGTITVRVRGKVYEMWAKKGTITVEIRVRV